MPPTRLAGLVWVWRYRLPERYGLEPPAQPLAPRFELVGSVRGSLAWVGALAWAKLPGSSPGEQSLVLAAGSSDGAVALWGAAVADLAQAPALGPGGEAAAPAPLRRWHVPCPPDLRTVTCLAAWVADDGASLLLAAGKTAGVVALWRGAALGGSSAEAAAAAAKAGAATVLPGLMGSTSLSGLAWLPGAGAPLLAGCSRDGALGCWRVAPAAAASGAGSQLTLVAVPGPKPCSKPKAGKGGHGAFGLAPSPNGLFVAVVRHSLHPAAEFQR